MSFGDLRLASSFSRRRLFRLAVHYKDRRLVPSLSFRAVFVTLFLPRFENVALVVQLNRSGIFIQRRVVTHRLRSHRLSPRKPFFRQSPAQPVLLTRSAPSVPASLYFLQNAQFFHGADWAFRSAGPGVRSRKRKSRGHEQRGK